MKLLLDGMISPRIARELREKGHDIQAIKKHRPELETVADREIVERMSEERRAVLTNDVDDFQPIHHSVVAAGKEHYGMVFTSDATMPRDKASIPLWVRTLDRFLADRSDEDALKNRVHFLP